MPMLPRPVAPFAVALALATTLAAAAPATAEGGATGTYALSPETVLTIVDAVAFRRLAWDGEQVVVLLATAPLDRAKWSATLDPAGLAEAYEDEETWVELEYQPDGTWTASRYGLRYEGGYTSGMSFEPAAAEGMKAVVGDDRVDGKLRASFGDGGAVDLTVAAPLLTPGGEALPADGGEAGAAARACNAAFAARDLPAVERSCEEHTAGVIDSALRMRGEGFEMEDPWTPAGASECTVAALSGLVVTGGVARGDEARLEASGGWTDDQRCAGPVFLRREGGRWRVTRSALALVQQP